ncbi:DUF1269 domain-containing protein [Nitrobacter vulgaris]
MGAVSGSFGGLLVGVLLLNPIIGAASGALTDFGINDAS